MRQQKLAEQKETRIKKPIKKPIKDNNLDKANSLFRNMDQINIIFIHGLLANKNTNIALEEYCIKK